MDLIYIILAAGLSKRFKSKHNNIEKQFNLINKKSILEICIESFVELNLNRKLFVVVSETRYNDVNKISGESSSIIKFKFLFNIKFEFT